MYRTWLCTTLFSLTISLEARAQSLSPSPIPEWARTRWETLAQIRSLQLSSHLKPQVLIGDFDGDSLPDVAIMVENRASHKIGIALLHRKGAVSRVIGAGREFGNGGDNFDWADSWKIESRTKSRPTDAIVIERESSASALIYFAKGMYQWKQRGD